MRPKHLQKIKEKVISANSKAIFVNSDFFDVVEPSKVSMCMKRLIDRGLLIRVIRGVYAKPDNKEPRINTVAQALARNFGWTIAPCGDTAIYLFNMSKDAPEEWTYVCDGQNQSYNVNGVNLTFRRTVNKNELSETPPVIAKLIQVIRAYGKGKLDDETLLRLAKRLRDDDKPKVLFGANKVTAWVKKYLKIIYDMANQDEPLRLSSEYDVYDYLPVYHNENKTASFFGNEFKSKSEALIAYSLRYAGINFKYEKKLYAKDGSKYKPDFTIKHNGKEYYWEHLGNQENKGYAQAWAIKEPWYHKFFPGQLLTTTEKTDIGVQIKKMLRNIFAFDLALPKTSYT